VSRVIKTFQELVEDNPPQVEKRLLYVTFDIVKEQQTAGSRQKDKH
jgi:hypothetical protein